MTDIAPSVLNKTSSQLRRQIADAERSIAHLNQTIAIARSLLVRLHSVNRISENWQEELRPKLDKDQ